MNPPDVSRSKPKPEGWGFPSQSRKAHYFRTGRSLCGKWGQFAGYPELDGTKAILPSPDDCAVCRRKLDKLRSVAAEVW